MSGVQCSGAERNGAQCSGTEWSRVPQNGADDASGTCERVTSFPMRRFSTLSNYSALVCPAFTFWRFASGFCIAAPAQLQATDAVMYMALFTIFLLRIHVWFCVCYTTFTSARPLPNDFHKILHAYLALYLVRGTYSHAVG